MSKKIPFIFNNRLYFFINKPISGNPETMITQIWSINNDGTSIEMLKELPIGKYLDYWDYDFSVSQTLLDDHNIYYFRFEFDYINQKNSICLWKTDLLNGESNLVKKIIYSGNNSYSNSFGNLKRFSDKIVFNSFNELWVSDGTEMGTILLKAFSSLQKSIRSPLELNLFPENYLITTDKLYFTANNGADDFELWVTDGTVLNTKLVKDVNTQKSSEVRDFKQLNNKVYFLANESELWTTNGTEVGTTLVKTFPKLDDGIIRAYIEAVEMPNNQICFANYSTSFGNEIWTSNENFENESILKNINIKNNSSYSNFEGSIKLKNEWYFNADDGLHGFELWKTDGTSGGTQMVKDFNANAAGIKIGRMFRVDDKIYFIALKTNFKEYQYLFRSDGTNEGTVQIDSVSKYSPFEELIGVNDRLFFTYANKLFVCNNNSLIPEKVLDFYEPKNLVSLGNRLIFTSGRELFSSDGTPQNTGRVFPYNYPVDYPFVMFNHLQFNNKVYFFGKKKLGNYDQGLYETDGTIEGTKIIFDFGLNNIIYSSSFLFLEKTSEKMFFRLDHKINAIDGTNFIDLWSSDGTSLGTKLLKKLPLPKYFGQNVKTQSIGNKIIISLQNNYRGFEHDFSDFIASNYIISSDGTSENTNFILKREFSSKGIKSFSTFNNKIYFSVDTQLKAGNSHLKICIIN